MWLISSLAAALYSHLYDEFLKDPEVVEITVEDPNDSFQIMRDVNDMKFLLKRNAFTGIGLSVTGYTKQTVMDFRKKWKINKVLL